MNNKDDRKEQNRKILKFFLYAIGMMFSIFYANHLKQEKNDFLINAVRNEVFGISGVSTELAKYTDEGNQVYIQIVSTGLPNAATNYKPALLAFVCANELLSQHLKNDKVVTLDMSANDRENGRNVNMRIQRERCAYDS